MIGSAILTSPSSEINEPAEKNWYIAEATERLTTLKRKLDKLAIRGAEALTLTIFFFLINFLTIFYCLLNSNNHDVNTNTLSAKRDKYIISTNTQ